MSTSDSPDQANVLPIFKSFSQMNLKIQENEMCNFCFSIVFKALSDDPKVFYFSFSSESRTSDMKIAELQRTIDKLNFDVQFHVNESKFLQITISELERLKNLYEQEIASLHETIFRQSEESNKILFLQRENEKLQKENEKLNAQLHSVSDRNSPSKAQTPKRKGFRGRKK
jgi:UDP-N-acetylmuramyl pentapeptide synthase